MKLRSFDASRKVKVWWWAQSLHQAILGPTDLVMVLILILIIHELLDIQWLVHLFKHSARSEALGIWKRKRWLLHVG